MNALKQAIITSSEQMSGRHDDPAVYGGPAGDPGLCGPDSVSWKINGDLASVSLAGTSAIILELLHPSVMAGVQQMSSYAEDPFRRARTTLGYVLTTTFGNTEAATGLINEVKRIHGYIHGTRPDGEPFDALDPTLLAWVHTSIPWMIMTAYERYNAPLTLAEKDQYLKEQAVIGRMGGGEGIPESVAELEEYVEAMRPLLCVTPQTLEFYEFLMTAPFLPPGVPKPLDRAVHGFFLHMGMTLAPEWAQRLSGFHNAGPVQRFVFPRYMKQDRRLLRWAFQNMPHLRLARARAAGAPRPDTAPLATVAG